MKFLFDFLNAPVVRADSLLLDFGPTVPTWGWILGFALVLGCWNTARLRLSSAKEGRAVSGMRALIAGFVAALICTVFSLLLVMLLYALLSFVVAGIWGALFGLPPMPTLRRIGTWLALVAALALAWFVAPDAARRWTQ